MSANRSSPSIIPTTMKTEPIPSIHGTSIELVPSVDETPTEPVLSVDQIPTEPVPSIDGTSTEPIPCVDEASTCADLCDRICSKLAKSKYCNGSEEKYLPEGCLDDLITEATIRKELSQGAAFLQSLENEQQFIKAINQRAKKVFATAVLTKLKGVIVYNAINKFEITDEKLPIEQDDNFISSLGEWDAEQFWKHQWKFLAPVFVEDTLEYHLETNHILPFMEVGGQQKEGTFGVVSEVAIHEAHQRHPGFMMQGKQNNIAVKEIVARNIAHGADQSSLAEVLKAYQTEATALNKISEVKHAHLIQFIAAINKKDKYYFLFPWADGGSLQDFWEKNPNPSLSPEIVRGILVQIRGLADALKTLHNYRGRMASFQQGIDADNNNSTGGGIRHGDLKPANILRFAPRDNNDIGTLKIADMGLAKHHEVNTRLRKNPTATRFGTTRYEPPEVGVPRATTPATSRLYDMWSMGCIMLEFLIWLLHGFEKLKEFNDSMRNNLENTEPSYYVVNEIHGQRKAANVNDQVTGYIKTLAKEPACAANTALGDLLDVVETKLLVVQLPPSSTEVQDGPISITPAEPIETNNGQYRASAESLLESLDDIIRKCKDNDCYLYTGRSRSGVHIIHTAPSAISNSSLHPNSALDKRPREGSATESPSLAVTRMSGNFDINVWEYEVDNGFATQFFDKLMNASEPLPLPEPAESDQLCKACLKLDFWAPNFYMVDSLSNLKERAKTCRFCKMRWDVSSHLERNTHEVRFDRAGSVIKMNESDPPVFSICRSNYSTALKSVQIGLPVLFEAGKTAHFKLIDCWLKECDSNHGHKCTSQPTGEVLLPAIDTNEDDLQLAILRKIQSRKAFKLPTRLIDVGVIDSATVRLYETRPGDKSEDFRYIALSHRWGVSTPEKPHFRTTVENKEALMEEIEVSKLPDTFRDAVITTRALGVQYLWIDSICIIQGKGGDFNSESKRMEDVFSAAYCVLAATCADGQWDGFLRSRPQREYVTFPYESDSSFYVCRYIDDFNHEVLEGDMNKRGWVLQERALARRTIYFASQQTYFECGAGVKCETLTKMENRLAAFLGDPNFPQVAILSHHSGRGTSRSEKILYYQDLYKKYSRLEFSHWEDRAVAMEGLEQRLSRAFESRGKFGILADKLGALNRSFLHRSLLWHRGTDQKSLTKIPFPPDRQRAPSWSWMAYRGGIDYLNVPFDSVDWESGDIRSPWQSTDVRTTGPRKEEVVAFGAVARKFVEGQKVREDVKIVYDETGMTDGSVSSMLCVVIGKTKGNAPMENKTHYVLLVAPGAAIAAKGTKVYERIGAGSMPGRFIDFKGPGLDIKIQ
ncbi:hypothetical protein F4801DRAFT_599888 [Xylaria longipes]|nr:hypothetical protein F4801DRAFT_599888 [Xylaria longipes]